MGVPIFWLRNLNQSIGLCNGTRLIVKKLGQRVIEAEIITRNNVDKHVFIPYIIMSPSGTNWPFVLHRCQFLVRMAFAMTINKNQGQTLNKRWGIFAISSLLPWSAICCYLKSHKQCKHQDFRRPRS